MTSGDENEELGDTNGRVSVLARPLRSRRIRAWLPDTLGVVWVLAAAFAVLLPALVHGASLGPYDVLSQYSLTKQVGVSVHNWRLIDQITQFVPWTTLAWTQVHSGHLPLWNPYSLLGMPLAFNWESATFSVPSLVGYLVPLHLAYTVQIVVTLIIAGTGVYVLGRVLGLGVLGCVMAATVCELSGPYIAWLGWPLVQVMSWAGWLFAATLLVVRGQHRTRSIVFFAVVCACLIYAGFPESAILLGLSLVVFLAVLLVRRSHWLGGSGPILRPVVDLVVAAVAGLGLGAPLMLPGLQLTAHSTRGLGNLNRSSALPIHSLVGVIFQGFDGLPEASSRWFDHSGFFPLYLQAYVGVIAVVMALVAIALKRKSPEVVAFGAVVIVTAALCFASPLVRLMQSLPLGVGRVEWTYALAPMAFSVAVLAGVGTDLLVRSRQPGVRRWAGGGFVGMGALTLGVWTFGRGDLSAVDAWIRAESFIWPTIETVVGLAAVGAMVVVHHRARGREASHRKVGDAGLWAATALVACETAFLIASGAPVMSSSPQFLVPTSAEVTLQHAVGSSLVGCGIKPCFTALGILPDVNVVAHVQELADYDTVIPAIYVKSWRAATGKSGEIDIRIFSPKTTTTVVARRFGIGFVLEPAATPGPLGAVFDKRVGDEDLYRIPGAAAATLTPLTSAGSSPPANAVGTPVTVTHPGPATWELTTDKATAQELRLRLTDVPGWHASIDGRPLVFHQFSGVMLEARIPAGDHTVELHYWPTAFTAGIVLAVFSVIGLSLGSIITWTRRRRTIRAGEPRTT